MQFIIKKKGRERERGSNNVIDSTLIVCFCEMKKEEAEKKESSKDKETEEIDKKKGNK